MALIDIIILIVFAVAVIVGFRKGFIVQIGSFAAIIVAIIACRLFGAQVSDLILSCFDETPSVWQRYSASALAYCGVYIVVYYAIVLIAKACRHAAKALMLGPVDRIGGALLSVFKWFMALSVAANLYIALFPGSNWLASSRLCGGKAATSIVGLAPRVLGQVSHLIPVSTEECNDSELPAKVSEDETR